MNISFMEMFRASRAAFSAFDPSWNQINKVKNQPGVYAHYTERFNLTDLKNVENRCHILHRCPN